MNEKIGVEAQLNEEIKKWMKRLEMNVDEIKAMSPKGVEFLTNIRAYQSDSLHFYNKGDLVRSFEALIWTWAYIEIGKNVGILNSKK